MAIKTIPVYPPVARNAAWQKKKSFKDKLKKATKTGLGVLLVRAEAAFGGINFNLLDVRRVQVANGPLTTQAAVTAAKKAAVTHRSGPVKLAYKAVAAAADKAEDVADNTALSDTARQGAQAIADRLAVLEKAINPANLILADFDNYSFKLGERVKKDRAALLVLLGHMKTGGEIVEDLPTMRDFRDSELHKYTQDINEALKESTEPELQAWSRHTFATLAERSYFPQTEEDVIPKLIELQQAQDRLERFVKQLR